MHQYIERLKKDMEDHPLEYSGYDARSLAEILYYFYASSNTVDSESVKAEYAELEALTRHLPFKESNAIFNTVLSIGAKQEKESFVAGVRVGMQLVFEMMGQ